MSFYYDILLDEDNNLAYVALQAKGVNLYDISNIEKPVFISNIKSKMIASHSL